VPVDVHVAATPAVARAALAGLLAGAPAGYDTTLAEGAKLLDVTVADGLARAMSRASSASRRERRMPRSSRR